LSWVENRILPAVKKNQAASACREAFDLILKKLKTPLSMQEKIQPQLSDSLANQFEAIKLKDEEQMDSELWTTDSLCYLSFNMVQEFRISHQVSYSYLLIVILECRFGFRGTSTLRRTRQLRMMHTFSKS